MSNLTRLPLIEVECSACNATRLARDWVHVIDSDLYQAVLGTFDVDLNSSLGILNPNLIQ
jgi:hypothetical protein